MVQNYLKPTCREEHKCENDEVIKTKDEVPQGTVLGCTLFNIYINGSINTANDILGFADKTAVSMRTRIEILFS